MKIEYDAAHDLLSIEFCQRSRSTIRWKWMAWSSTTPKTSASWPSRSSTPASERRAGLRISQSRPPENRPGSRRYESAPRPTEDGGERKRHIAAEQKTKSESKAKSIFQPRSHKSFSWRTLSGQRVKTGERTRTTGGRRGRSRT